MSSETVGYRPDRWRAPDPEPSPRLVAAHARKLLGRALAGELSPEDLFDRLTPYSDQELLLAPFRGETVNFRIGTLRFDEGTYSVESPDGTRVGIEQTDGLLAAEILAPECLEPEL